MQKGTNEYRSEHQNLVHVADLEVQGMMKEAVIEFFLDSPRNTHLWVE
jgi:hypothetical protein